MVGRAAAVTCGLPLRQSQQLPQILVGGSLFYCCSDVYYYRKADILTAAVAGVQARPAAAACRTHLERDAICLLIAFDCLQGVVPIA
jgi:hypothetical protein